MEFAILGGLALLGYYYKSKENQVSGPIQDSSDNDNIIESVSGQQMDEGQSIYDFLDEKIAPPETFQDSDIPLYVDPDSIASKFYEERSVNTFPEEYKQSKLDLFTGNSMSAFNKPFKKEARTLFQPEESATPIGFSGRPVTSSMSEYDRYWVNKNADYAVPGGPKVVDLPIETSQVRVIPPNTSTKHPSPLPHPLTGKSMVQIPRDTSSAGIEISAAKNAPYSMPMNVVAPNLVAPMTTEGNAITKPSTKPNHEQNRFGVVSQAGFGEAEASRPHSGLSTVYKKDMGSVRTLQGGPAKGPNNSQLNQGGDGFTKQSTDNARAYSLGPGAQTTAGEVTASMRGDVTRTDMSNRDNFVGNENRNAAPGVPLHTRESHAAPGHSSVESLTNFRDPVDHALFTRGGMPEHHPTSTGEKHIFGSGRKETERQNSFYDATFAANLGHGGISTNIIPVSSSSLSSVNEKSNGLNNEPPVMQRTLQPKDSDPMRSNVYVRGRTKGEIPVHNLPYNNANMAQRSLNSGDYRLYDVVHDKHQGRKEMQIDPREGRTLVVSLPDRPPTESASLTPKKLERTNTVNNTAGGISRQDFNLRLGMMPPDHSGMMTTTMNLNDQRSTLNREANKNEDIYFTGSIKAPSTMPMMSIPSVDGAVTRAVNNKITQDWQGHGSNSTMGFIKWPEEATPQKSSAESTYVGNMKIIAPTDDGNDDAARQQINTRQTIEQFTVATSHDNFNMNAGATFHASEINPHEPPRPKMGLSEAPFRKVTEMHPETLKGNITNNDSPKITRVPDKESNVSFYGPPTAAFTHLPMDKSSITEVRVPMRPLAGSVAGPQVNNHVLAKQSKDTYIRPKVQTLRSTYDVSMLGQHGAFRYLSDKERPIENSELTKGKKMVLLPRRDII
jgi:hypothetical protein